MKRTPAVTLVVLLLLSLIAVAQHPQMPTPGPEQKNLGYFAGNWKKTFDLKPGPMGSGGKASGTDHIEWMPGGFYLISHSTGSSPMGKWTGLAIYGYDAEKKVYTYDEFDSTGENIHATGSFDGKVWTWTSGMNMGGKAMKSRYVVTATSPTAYTSKFDMSEDGTNWTPVMDGSASKAAAAGTAKKK